MKKGDKITSYDLLICVWPTDRGLLLEGMNGSRILVETDQLDHLLEILEQVLYELAQAADLLAHEKITVDSALKQDMSLWEATLADGLPENHKPKKEKKHAK